MLPPTGARRRLAIAQIVFMLIYFAVLLPVVFAARRHLLPTGPLGLGLAVAPALPVFGLIWALLRYLSEEEDEYRRMLRVKAFVGATGLMLALTTAWGFIQSFEFAPMISLVWVFVLFGVCQVVVGLAVGWAER
jgi:cytochrome bd-type quinol oxidase subunit 2